MANYCVLTFDGGGVRGVLTARVLERLSAARPNFLARTDLFSGNSTGSILAVALAKGITPTELVQLYRDKSHVIFHHDLLHDLGDLWGLNGAKYSTKNRFDAIHPVIGDITLGDLPKRVLIPTFQLDSQNPLAPAPGPRTWKAKFLHNFPGSDSDGQVPAIEAVMRSSAAPTYFPIYEGFIDGGVVANNPSLCALAQALDPRGGKQVIQDISLLSLGTGVRSKFVGSTNGDWGLRQWGFTLVDLLFEAGSGLADFQCRQLLGDCYARVDAQLQQDIGLDAADRVQDLITIAGGVDLTAALQLIDTHWN